MHHETGTATTADDLEVVTRSWTPDLEAKAFVVLVHGVHEHSGRYAGVASELMRHGVAVRALDLRGHGLSPGERGQIETFGDYLMDVEPVIQSALEDAAGRPVFLMGHSMGGLVVSYRTVEVGTEGLAGIVLSSPALSVDSPAVLRKLAPLVSKWLPTLPVTRVDLSKLSRDPKVGRVYKEDPLTTTQGVRARLGHEILGAIETVREKPEAFDVPLLVYHGTADVITNPEGSKWITDHASSEDVTLALYDGLYHETHNELERNQVIGALADWIEARS
ncbi:lysophospholipase [Rubrivirga sp.]|uniref:alpha/beta hydrolase n=1 Tax=Rubrivirga sp. TaxID=1885344 RepID=UPI003C752EF2